MNKSEFKEKYGMALILIIFVCAGLAFFFILHNVFAAQDRNRTYYEMEKVIDYVKNQCIRYDDVSSESQTKSLISIVDKARIIRRELLKTDADGGDMSLSLKEYVDEERLTGIIVKRDPNSVDAEFYVSDGKPVSFWDETIKKFANVADCYEKSYSQRIVGDDGYYYDYAIISDGNNGIVLCYLSQLISAADGTSLNLSTLLDGFNISDMTIIVTNGTHVVASNVTGYENKPISDFEEIKKMNEAGSYDKLTKISLKDSSVYYGCEDVIDSFFIYTYLGRGDVFKEGNLKTAYFFVTYALFCICVLIILAFIKDSRKKQREKSEKEYRERLDRLATEAIRANQSKNDFLRRMSHDIRTPINGIQGMVRIGEYYADDPEKQKECRKKILEASGYLLELVNDVLDMSKLDENLVIWKEEHFDMNSVMNEIVSMLSFQASEHSVTLTYESKIIHSSLYGGAGTLKRICANIIGNAIKYNKPNGNVDCSIKETRSDDQKAYFTIVCADTGIGMSEEFQKIMYEPFAQENPDFNSNGSTGLGLAIVKKAIDLMGGDISVQSKTGEGTTFTINLPFAIDCDDRKETAARNVVSTKKLDKTTVLLVEDNDLNYEIAKFILETNGAKVLKASNGKQALDIFSESEEGEISVILMDVMMPVMDGISATAAIRSLDRSDASVVPIIAMTANTYTDDIERVLAAGMNAFVEKPVDAEKLVDIIVKTLQKR